MAPGNDGKKVPALKTTSAKQTSSPSKPSYRAESQRKSHRDSQRSKLSKGKSASKLTATQEESVPEEESTGPVSEEAAASDMVALSDAPPPVVDDSATIATEAGVEEVAGGEATAPAGDVAIVEAPAPAGDVATVDAPAPAPVVAELETAVLAVSESAKEPPKEEAAEAPPPAVLEIEASADVAPAAEPLSLETPPAAGADDEAVVALPAAATDALSVPGEPAAAVDAPAGDAPAATDVAAAADAPAVEQVVEQVVATTGSLAGQLLPSSWVAAFKDQANAVVDFVVGERCWMQNPFFKDGTRLRVGPRPEDEMLDQYILNDDEVEIVEVEGDFVRVRPAADATASADGWVRSRNISRIERQAGLPDLGELALEVVSELGKREEQIVELEGAVLERDNEIASLKLELEALRAAASKQAAEGEFDANPLSVGERVFMLNPNFTDGTRLRSGPLADSEFTDAFIMNDREVEVLEVNDDFVKVRESAEGDEGAAGWVRNRNVTRTKRESGLAALKQEMAIQMPGQLTRQPTVPAIQTEASATIASQADAAAYEAAAKAQADRELAAELASILKAAVEKLNIKTTELFRDWAGPRAAHIDRKDFIKAIGKLGEHLEDEQIGAIFDIWDSDKDGLLEFKEVDRAIRGAKLAAGASATGSKTSAIEFQKALNERLQGRVSADKGRGRGGRAAAAESPNDKKKPTKANKKAAAAAEEALGEYEETGDEPEGTWAASKWLNSLGISAVITKALRIPSAAVKPAFDFVRSLSEEDVGTRLREASLAGLCEVLLEGLRGLKKQKVSGSAQLNDKFQATGKFQMSYGSLNLFYGGLEMLLGPPQMHKEGTSDDALATLMQAMENDHCAMIDSKDTFRTPNGAEAVAMVEWEFVVRPNTTDLLYYPERDGMRETNPALCRRAMSLDALKQKMETEANVKLRKEGHSELIDEELVGGRLYTGPMYAKYNAVLRAKSKVAFLVTQAKELCRGNDYVTTIHAVNSCVLKLSKLTKACNVWRGIKDAKLPPEFWVPNELGVRGGIEYGFSSTTTDKNQAIHYANVGTKAGDAMTIFEMRMGMVDRGADLSWLSQYPHEKEVLLPPLTGVEALNSDVEGNMLVIQSRFSLNLSAQTLEQVLSRRRKMLMDMAKGIELDLREALDDSTIDVALMILRKALECGPYKMQPEWFNNDDNFARVMQETLYLQSILVDDIDKLKAAMSKTELNLKGWKTRSSARIMLVSGWLHARHAAEKTVDIAIDLREVELNPLEGEQLAQLLRDVPKLTSVDVRGNETLGEQGAAALEAFMRTVKVKSSTSVAHSLCGVTPANSSIAIPKKMPAIDLRIMCAELENSVWAEGVSAAMGAKSKGSSHLNRRGGTHQTGDSWKPLIWAAKENQLLVAGLLIDHGFNVNEQETALDKALSGAAPLHRAAEKGLEDMIKLLLSRGASPTVKDKHGRTPSQVAHSKGYADVVALLDAAEKGQAKEAKAKEAKTAPTRQNTMSAAASAAK